METFAEEWDEFITALIDGSEMPAEMLDVLIEVLRGTFYTGAQGALNVLINGTDLADCEPDDLDAAAITRIERQCCDTAVARIIALQREIAHKRADDNRVWRDRELE